MSKILVADDDEDIVQLISDLLTDEGFQVAVAYDGEQVLRRIEEEEPDLLILDVMMPRMDGLEVLRHIRHRAVFPILMLSAKGRELDRVIGLEVGADDYMTKPFATQELIARVRAHLRRQERQREAAVPYPADTASLASPLVLGGLMLNKQAYEAYYRSERLDLSAREFQILLLLAEHRHQVLSREQIYDAIWGSESIGDPQTVTVHLTNLRKKMSGCPYVIRTIWGVGYKLAEESE